MRERTEPITVHTPSKKPDYGIDAPYVSRNLAIAGVAMLALAGAAMSGALPKELAVHADPQIDLRISVVGNGLSGGLALIATACWMYCGSRSRKLVERERLLDRIAWRGDERVLDVGCGRGLLLVGAARRLTTGRAVGVDIWKKEDLSDNRAEGPLANAEAEGVSARVSVETADMRRLPFDDASFDVVASRAAIHNLTSAADRAAAIREIARVMKPGGKAIISDIRNLQAYAKTFAENGCGDVRFLDSKAVSAFYALMTIGALRPNTILVQKAI